MKFLTSVKYYLVATSYWHARHGMHFLPPAEKSPPVMGDHTPPGASHWQLPPPENKMVFIDLSPRELCMVLKDPKRNGGKDGQKLISHFADDKLVAWGWNPAGNRTVPPLTKEQTRHSRERVGKCRDDLPELTVAKQ